MESESETEQTETQAMVLGLNLALVVSAKLNQFDALDISSKTSPFFWSVIWHQLRDPTVISRNHFGENLTIFRGNL